ncbi:MAG: BatA domain-containing protein [Betaproteobacteria bacterium]
MSTLALQYYVPLLALVGAIAVVTLLYWLKPPPRTVVVASSLVWDRVLRESHPSPDRLRWWLSLLLAALIAVLVVGSVMPLRSATNGVAISRLIVVLDNSPTMATRTTDGTTRWDHALTRARALIHSRAADSEIWLTDTMRRIAIPGFRTRDDALAQLQALRVSHGSAPLVSLPNQAADIETVVITDGVSLGPVTPRARLESVFEAVENAGITAFEVRTLPVDPRREFAYVELFNASGVEKRIELAIAGVGNKRVSRLVSVAARAAHREMIDISDFGSGPVRASITMPGDGLAIDDVAYAILPLRRVMRVALVTSGNAFLENSLQAQPRVSLTVVAPARNFDERNFDLLVFDRIAPKNRSRVPALLFRPTRADWLPPLRRTIADVPVTTWDAAHPLLDNISLFDLSVDRAAVVDLKDRTKEMESVLASGSEGVPLIVVHEAGVRWISFAFALDESNFALHSGFPIFLNNVLNWVAGDQPALLRGLGLIEVPLADARVVAADGRELDTQSIAGGSLLEVDTPGLYTAVSAHQRLRMAANLFDRRISDVNKSALAAMKPDPDQPVTLAPWLAFDASFVLLLVAALLLLFEWWSWNRRMTV